MLEFVSRSDEYDVLALCARARRVLTPCSHARRVLAVCSLTHILYISTICRRCQRYLSYLGITLYCSNLLIIVCRL